jgi:hypothetical protein
MTHVRLAGFVTMLWIAAPALSTPTVQDQLTRLAQEIVYTSARLHPTVATRLGIAGHDGDLETPTEAARAA